MTSNVLIKAPADILDYEFNFTRWLPTNDRIDSATANLANGASASIRDVEWSDQTVRVWLEGGADNDTGVLTVLINTAEGRTKEVTAQLRIRENF